MLGNQHSGSRGFTLLELIMVLMIAGIVAVSAGISWSGRLFIRAQAEQLAQDIRYTQALAMSRNNPFTIQWVSEDTYAIMDADGDVVPPYPLRLSGVTIEVFSIVFSASVGMPVSDTLSVGLFKGDEFLSVIVTDLTGMVLILP